MKTLKLSERILLSLVLIMVICLAYFKIVLYPIKGRLALYKNGIKAYENKINSLKSGSSKNEKLTRELEKAREEYEALKLYLPKIGNSTEIIKKITDYSNQSGAKIIGMNTYDAFYENTKQIEENINTSNYNKANIDASKNLIIIIPVKILLYAETENNIEAFIAMLYNDNCYKCITSVYLDKTNKENTYSIENKADVENKGGIDNKGDEEDKADIYNVGEIDDNGVVQAPVVNNSEIQGSIIVEGSGENLKILSDNFYSKYNDKEDQKQYSTTSFYNKAKNNTALSNTQGKVQGHIAEVHKGYVSCEISVNYYFASTNFVE